MKTKLFALAVVIAIANPTNAKELQQFLLARSDTTRIVIALPDSWNVDNREIRDESGELIASPVLVGPNRESVIISAWKVIEQDVWLDSRFPAGGGSRASCTTANAQRIGLRTGSGEDGSFVRVAWKEGDLLLEVNVGTPPLGETAAIEELLREAFPGSIGACPEVQSAIRDLPTSSTECCGATDDSANSYGCCSQTGKPKGNCTTYAEFATPGEAFRFGGPGTGRNAYTWMSLAYTYNSGTQKFGGTIPAPAAIGVFMKTYGPDGHVWAYKSLNADSSVEIQEQLWCASCTRTNTYSAATLRTHLAGYIYTDGRLPEPTPKAISTSSAGVQTIVDDFNFTSTYNFGAFGPGHANTYNGGQRAWFTSSNGYNSYFHGTLTKTGSTINYGVWALTVPGSASILAKLEAYIPNSTFVGATRPVYSVSAAGQTITSQPIDQKANLGKWVELKNPNTQSGSWSLPPGVSRITLSDNYGGVNSESGLGLAMDAIRVSYLGPDSSSCQMTVPQGQWKAQYWNNKTLTGSPKAVRPIDSTFLDKDFGNGSPAPECGVPADGFSARFEKTANFTASMARFTITCDDGCRLYIDGSIKLDKWFDQPPTTYSVDVNLTAGNHAIRVDFYENGGGAAIKLSWQATQNPCQNTVPSTSWRADYFNNTTLSGQPSATMDLGGLLHRDYQQASPAPPECGVGADRWSARYSRTLNVSQAGTYVFIVKADDGVRLKVNGTTIIDKWMDEPATVYFSEVDLVSGNNSLVVEHYDNTGDAQIYALWYRVCSN